MRRITFEKKIFDVLAGFLICGMAGLAVVNGQAEADPSDPSVSTAPASPAPAMLPGVKMTATLVNAERKAAAMSATVNVDVSGIELVDPDIVEGRPVAGQGHLHYQLDDGPVIATPFTKLSFHALSSGDHRIRVLLAANDHSALGPEETLMVRIP